VRGGSHDQNPPNLSFHESTTICGTFSTKIKFITVLVLIFLFFEKNTYFLLYASIHIVLREAQDARLGQHLSSAFSPTQRVRSNMCCSAKVRPTPQEEGLILWNRGVGKDYFFCPSVTKTNKPNIYKFYTLTGSGTIYGKKT